MTDDSEAVQPTLRHARQQRFDHATHKFVRRTEKLERRTRAHKSQEEKDKKQPAGGFDDTLPPYAPPGYTLQFIFHLARHLPFADVNTLSSDPYIIATLKTDLQKRHKEDPDLRFRTPTIHRKTDPTWDAKWIVANVPASGFFLKCRIYDEDPADHDDRLGNVHVSVDGISDTWPGIKEQTFEIKARMGSKRAYLVRGCATMFSGNFKLRGEMVLSVENLGRTPGENGSKAYTVGPLYWSRHFSPLIGRLVGTKDADDNSDQDGKKKTQKYNFQAIQMQFAGPIPDELYHRYVEFKPFVAGMFTSHSLRGRILNRALHHQHARIYNYDRSTVYGVFEKPTIELTKQFLEFVHYDKGGRIFTYVITLDGQWRFTETGKEFGIDLLSKHTMHSDVNIYIAFSGEFFVRKLRKRSTAKEGSERDSSEDKPDETTIETPVAEPQQQISESPSLADESYKDPQWYELIIDNDSGTYRPTAKKLHLLRELMERNLPGLKVRTLDCQADQEKMKKLKDQQREVKKKGRQIVYQQNYSDSNISSIDDEKLEQRTADVGDGTVARTKHRMQQAKEDIKDITAGQAGSSGGDGAVEGGNTAMVAGHEHQTSTTQEREPVSSEKTDGVIGKEDGERTNGEQKGNGHGGDNQNHQETKDELVLKEKLGQGNGDVLQPSSAAPYHSQATMAA